LAFFGEERASSNGDSFAGFWLTKTAHTCSGSGSFSNGNHDVGDLLVVSNYTNGGRAATVQLYEWVGGGSPLNLLGSGFTCGVVNALASNDICGIANANAVTEPWAPKLSLTGNQFIEVGVDITDLFPVPNGQAAPCFGNFIAETRSSQQTTATLKDFTTGTFNTCIAPPLSTTATGGSSALPGSSQHDVATVSSPGGGLPTPTGTITFSLCRPNQITVAGCPAGAGTQVGSPVTISSGHATSADVTGATTPNDLDLGKYCWRADYAPDTAASNHHYGPTTETNATVGGAGGECFSVVKGSPALTTSIGVTGNGDLGSTSYGDTATLSPTVGSPGPGETVAFSLFGPYATGTTPTCAVGAGQPVFTTTGPLSGSGGTWTAVTAASFTPTAIGTYVWTASYAGDALNNAASEPASGSCDVASEKATIVAPGLHITKTADAPSVTGGAPIGFTVTVSNGSGGTGTGKAVAVADPLPSGQDVSWSISPAYSGPGTCDVTGSVPTQVLSCALGDLAIGASASVHIVSATTFASAGSYPNTATATPTNAPAVSASAATKVLDPNLSITKTADSATVGSGSAIGFTITTGNASGADVATATSVTLNDPLPGASGVSWSIDTQPTGNPCAISGSAGSQVLACSFGDLAAGSSASVHITSPTTSGSWASPRPRRPALTCRSGRGSD
ncbi:MAG: DUF11 domain-containing protein, partial [Chloroflexi bacterium]